MAGHSQQHSTSNCHDEVIGLDDILLSYFFYDAPPSSLCETIFFRRIISPVHVAVQGAWDFVFVCSLVWHVNAETCFCLKGSVCPKADKVAQFPPSLKYGCLLCFRLRLLWPLHSRYAGVFGFSTSIPIPLCSLLSLCDRGSSGFCVLTVPNIEHKRKRDTQAKASFWYSNYEYSFSGDTIQNSNQFICGLCELLQGFIENSPNTLLCHSEKLIVLTIMHQQLSVNGLQKKKKKNTRETSFQEKTDRDISTLSVPHPTTTSSMCSFQLSFQNDRSWLLTNIH